MEKKKWLGIALSLFVTIVTLQIINVQYAFIALIGKSMNPALIEGDILLVKRGPEDVQIGDIICFKINSIDRTGIVHRVIDVRESPALTFRTKGDANAKVDEWEITPDQIIGKVIFVIPAHVFLEPYMPSVVIAASVLLISLVVIYSRAKNQKQKALLRALFISMP